MESTYWTIRIDVIATDHAPHTLEEKMNPYTKAPSGGPLDSACTCKPCLISSHQGKITLERDCGKMCHAPAQCFELKERGYIREGYFADLALVEP